MIPRKSPQPAKKHIDLGAIFLLGVRAFRMPTPIREHRFHSRRMWRFDFAWPELMIAVEIEGGTTINGAHVRPAGYRKDCQKYNEAALLGWKVIRGDSKMVKDGTLLQFAKRALEGSGNV